jgi:transcriptional regulator with XRE-family HTH domain
MRFRCHGYTLFFLTLVTFYIISEFSEHKQYLVTVGEPENLTLLRIWRKSLGQTQERLAAALGEKHKTYSSYERGASPLPPETLAKLRNMGYDGPAEQHPERSHYWINHDDFHKTINDLRELLETRLASQASAGEDGASRKPGAGSRTKPPDGFEIRRIHIEEAWNILARAADASKHPIQYADRNRIGMWIGRTAERLARNPDAEDKRVFLAGAKQLLRSGKSGRGLSGSKS